MFRRFFFVLVITVFGLFVVLGVCILFLEVEFLVFGVGIFVYIRVLFIYVSEFIRLFIFGV